MAEGHLSSISFSQANAFVNENPLVTVASSILLAAVALYASPLLSRNKNAIIDIGGSSIFNAFAFFDRRYDFIWGNFAKTKEKLFKARIFQHDVVAISGEDGRKVFYNNRSLSFNEGYRLLYGGAPKAADINVNDNDLSSRFPKQILSLLNKDRLTDILPTLLEDVDKRMTQWGTKGKINPFESVYDLVFQMTVRMATCQDLAEDTHTVLRTAELFRQLEKSSTATSLLLPWLPSSARKTRISATRQIFDMFHPFVEARRKATPSNDAVDVLIAEGKSNEEIVAFISQVVFAGVVNTGVTSCWILLYLAAHPEWKQKVTAEIHDLISKYADTTSDQPLHKRLAGISISAWEDSTPFLEVVIRETLRIIKTNTNLRRNIAEDVQVAGKVVNKGAFLVFNTADVHLNPSIYPDPLEFDPERYGAGREEDKKEAHAYVAWGAGRHPCAGMKVAKLEMKLIVALFVAGYDYKLVDASGKFPEPFPQIDRNDHQQARPLGAPCYLEFDRVME